LISELVSVFCYQHTEMRSIVYLALLIAIFGISSCYYDKYTELYPISNQNCDTSAVTYKTTISSVMALKCNTCHSASAAATFGGNIITDNYTNLQVLAANGRLYGSITFDPKYFAMPKDGNKLSACDISYIRTWINAGAPNN